MARPLSLQARSLAAAGFALAAFLGLAFFALDEAFYNAAKNSLHERLQGYIYAYLAGFDVSRSGKLIPPEIGPDPRFDQPASSGLYAGVIGEKNNEWRSPSANERQLPFDQSIPRGEVRFSGPLSTPAGQLFILSQGVDWNIPNRDSIHLTFYVAEDVNALTRQVMIFRRTLLAWLGGLGILLLLLLLAVLRWSLSPLREVTADLAGVEHGEQTHLSGNYPIELAGLANNLNDFIDSERERLTRYRHTLADLAHSLKTPLAVMRSQMEATTQNAPLQQALSEQVERMDAIVAYQLSRAATSGQQTFATPLSIDSYAEEIVRSLEKVYASKSILCEFDVAPEARFYGEQGDLMEILGNLLENAFKWSRHRVLLTAKPAHLSGMRRAGMELNVEDDGPGIPEDRVEHLLQRGVRGDERVQGHGIGLAIVQDILKAYRSELNVTRSPTLGGARFTIHFHPS